MNIYEFEDKNYRLQRQKDLTVLEQMVEDFQQQNKRKRIVDQNSSKRTPKFIEIHLPDYQLFADVE